MLELATVERKLAGLYELQCAWDAAFAARRIAAESFRALGGRPPISRISQVCGSHS